MTTSKKADPALFMELKAASGTLGDDQEPVLGPGCCTFVKNGTIIGLSNVGNRETCEQIVAKAEGKLISYTQGQDCS